MIEFESQPWIMGSHLKKGISVDYETHSIDVSVGGRTSAMPVLVFRPEGKGPHPTMIIMQHLPVAHAGLEKDPFQIETGKRYANSGFTVVMPFMFHWWPSEEPMDKKREEFRDDWTVADLKATWAWMQKQSTIDDKRVGIVGHCWGGRMAWLAACHLPHLKACGVFYGGRVKAQFVCQSPAPVTLAENIKCPVIGIFGNDDQNPSPADVNDYQAALRKAGVDNSFHRYDGAGHGFQDFTNDEKFRQTQSEDAWGKATAFFRHYVV